MKIMYISNGNGLSDNLGGSLSRTINVAKRLQKKGHEIYFLTTSGGFKACTRESLNANYYALPASLGRKEEHFFFDRFLAYVISTIAFPGVLSQLPKVDIVYTDSDYFCDIVPAILYKKRNKALWVAMTHHRLKVTHKKPRDLIISSVSSALQSFAYLQFKKHANKVFVYKSNMGKLITKHLISIGMPPSKIETVANGVDSGYIDSLPKKSKIYDACFIGGLRPSKGIYHIIPIWKNVVKKKNNALLVIVGGGLKEYEDELRSLINKEGLESCIRMLGAKNHNEALNVLAKSKIFFFPSNEEGWAIAICEAMACGLPVVAWDLPVYKTLYPKGVVRVPTGNIQEFSNAILELLADKNHYEEVSKDSREIVSTYDWDNISMRESEIFQNLLKFRSGD